MLSVDDKSSEIENEKITDETSSPYRRDLSE